MKIEESIEGSFKKKVEGQPRERTWSENDMVPKLEEGDCDCYSHDDTSEGFCAKNCWTKSSVLARDKQLAKLLDDALNGDGTNIQDIITACEEVLSVLNGETKC